MFLWINSESYSHIERPKLLGAYKGIKKKGQALLKKSLYSLKLSISMNFEWLNFELVSLWFFWIFVKWTLYKIPNNKLRLVSI